MDLLTLITVCSLDYERATMHRLIAVESHGEPYSYRVIGEGENHTFDTPEAAIEAALAEQDAGKRVRIGLTGLQADLRAEASKPLAGLWEPCANIALAARQLAQFQKNCGKADSTGSDAYCAIARWHAPEGEPPADTFAQNVLLYPESELPNPTLAATGDGSAQGGSAAPNAAPAPKAPPEPEPGDEWRPRDPSKKDSEIIEGGGTLFFDDVDSLGVQEKGDRDVIVEAGAGREAPTGGEGASGSDETAADPDGTGSEDADGWIQAQPLNDDE